MTTALIADDEPALLRELREQLAEAWPELDIVAEARNGLEAAERIAALQPDIAFLDIRMPGLSGLEVAQGIEGDTRVVFVTAHDEFAVQAFERAAVDYLLKPASRERLAQAVARLKDALAPRVVGPEFERLLRMLAQRGAPSLSPSQSQSPSSEAANTPPPRLRWIRASRGDTTFHIPVDDVLYFQSDDKYTTVVTAAGEHLIRTPLAELLRQLDPERFWQVHRSTVVQADRIEASQRDGDGRMLLRLRGSDAQIVVSRAYQHLFRQM